jgi:hypothetical protein
MGFIFNFDNFKKGKKKVNPFDLVEDFDYDFAESFETEDYEDLDDFYEDDFYRDDELD